VKFQKLSNFFENIESKSHMTERKKKWKRKGADSPLGSNNLNEAEEENDSNGLTNGNGKSPLKQLDPTNSSSPSAHSNSKSSKQEGEAKETAENGHISHEMNGNGTSKHTPPRGKSRSNGNSNEGAGNEHLSQSPVDNIEVDRKKSPNSKPNGEALHENATKIPLSARRHNKSPSHPKEGAQDQSKDGKSLSAQENGGISQNGASLRDDSSNGVTKESMPSVPPEIKVEQKLENHNVKEEKMGDDIEAMMLFESFLTNVQSENSQSLPDSNEENGNVKKRKQSEDDLKNRPSKLLADETLDGDRPKRARKPIKMEDYDPDFDEKDGELYSPLANLGNSVNGLKKTPVKDSQNGAEKFVSPRKTPSKKESGEVSKKTPKKKRPQEVDDEDDYDSEHNCYHFAKKSQNKHLLLLEN